jgi:hypothetical protein
VTLSPTRRQAYDELMGALSVGDVFALSGGIVSGKSTVLREGQRATGGRMPGQHPLAQAEALARVRRPSRPQWFMPSVMAEAAVAALDGEGERPMSVGFTTFAGALGGVERYDGP